MEFFTKRHSLLNLLLLLATLPIVLFVQPATLPFLAVLVIIPLTWLLIKGRLAPTTPFNICLLIIVVMVVVSLFVTPDRMSSMRKVVNLIYGILLFFCLTEWAGESRHNMEKGVLLTLLLAQTMVVVGFVATGFGLFSRLPLPEILEPNPNELAGILTYQLPLLVAIAFGMWRAGSGGWFGRNLNRPLSIFLFLTALANLMILYITRSRAAWIGIACGFFALAIMAFANNRLVQIFLAFTLVTIVFAGVRFIIVSDAISDTSTTLTGRPEVWSRAIYALQDFPLTGLGMNRFRFIVHDLYPFVGIPNDFDIAHAHDHLLQAGLDLGIPGMIAYLGLWVVSGLLLHHLWRNASDCSRRFVVAGLTSSLLAHFVFGMADAIALGARPSFVLWMLFGLVAANGQLLRNTPARQVNSGSSW